jgi:transcriptional regulator with XRE-family HTH domain
MFTDAASTPTYTMNNKGYSRKFAAANKKADSSHVGVQLGRICIAKDIPVPDVAEYLGVSRQAVYLWFLGKSTPHPKTRETLKELIARFKAK